MTDRPASALPPENCGSPSSDDSGWPVSRWSVEHFGFDDDHDQAPPALPDPSVHVPQWPVLPSASSPAMPARTPRSRGQHRDRGKSTRVRTLLASGAIALGLTAGGAGWAAVAASADGGDTARAAVAQLDGDHGHRAGHGGRR